MTPQARPHPAWVTADFTLAELVACLDVEMDGSSRVEVASLASSHGGILGAQMLGQALSACESATPGKDVVRLSMSFLRPSRADVPLAIGLRHFSNGRRFAVVEVDLEQEGRLVARGEAMLGPSNGDGELVDADVAVPGAPSARALWPWEVAEPSDDADTGAVWSRVPLASLSPRASRAVLAYATEPLTVPLMIDRRGLRERGGEIPQAVLAHSITFASTFDARRWHLHRPEIDGLVGDVLTGRGTVLDGAGRRVATTGTISSLRL